MMATGGSTLNKGTFQPDSDVHITYEDQQKINKFARLNAKLEDLKDEVEMKETKLQNLKDACDELELADECDKIPYLIGEVFIYRTVESAQTGLEDSKTEIQEEIEGLKRKCTEVQELMTDLKSHLYGKFGSHINLEVDDD